MKLRLLVSALLPALALAFLAIPATAAAETDVDVTFPSVTRFNQDVTDYVVRVVDRAPDTGDLYVINDSQVSWPVPADGLVTVPFDYSSDAAIVRVLRCTFGCVEVARSEPLAVYNHVSFSVVREHSRPPLRSGPVEREVALGALPAGEEMDVAWEVLAPDQSVVASGTQTLGHGAASRFRYDVPPGLEQNARYHVVADLSLDTEDFGLLEGLAEDEFVYDDDADGDVRLPDAIATFYPAPDRYLDRLKVTATFLNGGLKHANFDVLDSQGRLVRTFKNSRPGNYLTKLSLDWDGTVGSKQVPAGRYTLRVRGEDRAGNLADVRRTFRVADEKVVWKTWRSQIVPGESMINSTVGTCSSLKKLRAGGLGLYSQVSCTKAKQSVVATVHGVYLPDSFFGAYRDLRVDVKGGGARGASGAYLVLGYVEVDGDFSRRAEFDGSKGRHRGKTASDKQLIHDSSTERPYIVWQTGLTAGSRYDIKKFPVTIRYQKLV